MTPNETLFDVTCLSKELKDALDFAVRLFGHGVFTREDGRVRPAWSEPAPSVLAIGTGSMQPYKTGPNRGWARKPGKGWTDYDFDYDPALLAGAVTEYLIKNWPPKPGPDPYGALQKAFRIRSRASAAPLLPHEDLSWEENRAILAITPDWLESDP